MSVTRPNGTQTNEIPYHRQRVSTYDIDCVITDADRRYLAVNRNLIRENRSQAKARYLSDCATRYRSCAANPANLPHAYCGG